MIQKVSFYAVFVWFLGILFFLYEFFIRVLPATVSEEIIRDLSMKPSEFAIFGALYYVPYSIMQIPVGIIYDRYGVRLFLTIACAVCATGVLIFAYSEHFMGGAFGRLLMGFGSSFGFISLLILALNWFPHKYFAFLAGLGQMIGAVGPLLAGAPIAYLMLAVNNDWQLIFYYVGFFGVILSCLIAFFVRNKPKTVEGELVYIEKTSPLLGLLKKLVKIPQMWPVMIYTGTVYVCLPIIGAYWGTLYLQARGFDTPKAALIVSMIWVGLATGSPIIGKFSDRYSRRKPFLIGAALFGSLITYLIVYLPTQNEYILIALFTSLGFAAGGQSLSFALISDVIPLELRATAIGASNSFAMMLASTIPVLVSWCIQYKMGDRIEYIQSDFQLGLTVMPIMFFIAFVIALFWIRESFCRQQDMVHYLNE
jgi:MFS family permease